MKNIKTIELVKPRYGLAAGSTLSRLSPDESFTFVGEHVAEGFTSKRTVSVSPSLIESEFARATEWFERRKPAREVIAELESELVNSKETIAKLEDQNNKLGRELEWYKAVVERIAAKRAEFELKLKEVEDKLADDMIAGETMEWADEAMTVYYNMIDLLKKITA